MRRLTLLRHAKSSWDDESLDDFHRPLNERGRHSAKAMGAYLSGQGAAFDLILASPAIRVVQTLEGLVNGGWISAPVQFDPAVYHAGYRDLLGIIRKIPDEVQSVMISGHNPTIGVLAAQLCRNDDDSGRRADLATKYPTGALAEIELDVDHWADVEPQCGRLAAFITPRSLPNN